MSGSELVFNIFARDRGASGTFRKVGKAAAGSSNDIFKLSKVTKALGDSFDKLQSGGKIAAIGGAAITTIPHVLALTATLANVAPAAYAIVPAALAGGLALGTLKLAMSGVADALGNLGSDSKSTKKFDEALKSLSPSARSFAVEMKRLYPALVAVRKVVQETAFHGMAAQLRPLAANLLPTVRRGLVGVASAGNSAVLQLAAFFRTGQAKSLLGTALTGVVTALKGMSDIPAKLGKSLLQIAVAAMPAFQRLTGVMTGFFTKFANYVNNKSAGGAFAALINGAIDTLAQLGRVAGGIGAILGGVFKAAGNGSGFLDSIERVTTAIANAVNSKKGQEVLSKVFEMMSKAGPIIAIGGAIALVVGAIGSALVAVAEPAAAIAVGVAAVGAGFAFLYTKSAGLRDIVGMVGAKLRDLWSLFAAKGLPVLKDFATKGLHVAVVGFNAIRDAIVRNKPELEQLWSAFKSLETFMMSNVWPVIGKVIIAAFKGIFTSIVTIVDIIGSAIRYFNFFKGTVLTVFGAIVHGAADAFGWVPKVGDHLRVAASKFDAFAKGVSGSTDKVRTSVGEATGDINVLKQGIESLERQGKPKIVVDKSSAIADLNVLKRKAEELTHPLKVAVSTTNAKLALSALKIRLAEISDKEVLLRTRGGAVAAADINALKVQAEALERAYWLRFSVYGADASAGISALKGKAEKLERQYMLKFNSDTLGASAAVQVLRAKAEKLERQYVLRFASDTLAAAADINVLKRKAESLDGRVVTTYYKTLESHDAARFGNLPGRASGGPVKAGQPYIVGEHRPEVFVPSQNGTIMPSVAGAGRGAGGTVINNTFHINAANASAREVAEQIRKIVQVQGGGDVQVAFGR